MTATIQPAPLPPQPDPPSVAACARRRRGAAMRSRIGAGVPGQRGIPDRRLGLRRGSPDRPEAGAAAMRGET
jgi:hypothetical protein